jgi:hypothetical protein
VLLGPYTVEPGVAEEPAPLGDGVWDAALPPVVPALGLPPELLAPPAEPPDEPPPDPPPPPP